MPKKERLAQWGGLSFQAVDNDDITQGVAWSLEDAQHTIILHRHGRMNALETAMNGKVRSVGPALPGEIWIIPAQESYLARAQGDSISYSVASLRPNIFDSFEKKLDWNLARLHASSSRLVHRIGLSLETLMAFDDDISVMAAETLGFTLSQHLYTHYMFQGGSPLLGRITFSKKTETLLREYIQENLAEPLTLDTLAALTRMSPHNFLISFRTSFGKTPAQYIIHQRLRYAQWLLLNTQRDITTIAQDTGFASHSHLTSRFKQALNMTPSEYRMSLLR